MDLEDPSKQVPELLRRELEKLDAMRAKAMALQDAAKCAEDIESEFDSIVKSKRINLESYGISRVWISIDVDSIHEATPILQLMAKRGFRQTDAPLDMPGQGTRTYWADPVALQITFNAHREAEKVKIEREQKAIEKGEIPQQQCAYVKIGEKTVDVMELRCAGDPAYEAHFNKEG